MKVIGLTGGIGTGKSSVAGFFREKGVPVIDLDEIVHELQRPGKQVYRRIVEEFGESILNSDGTINRKLLGKIVFSDRSKLEKLNSIVHPAVIEKLKDILMKYQSAGQEMLVVEVPLLYEVGLEKLFDHVVVVYAPEEIQIERIMKRDGLSREEALSRIRNQLSIEEKRRRADVVIDNSGNLEKTRKEFERVFSILYDSSEKGVRI